MIEKERKRESRLSAHGLSLTFVGVVAINPLIAQFTRRGEVEVQIHVMGSTPGAYFFFQIRNNRSDEKNFRAVD